MARIFGRPGGPPDPTSVMQGAAVPAVGFWRFYDQYPKVLAVDHTGRNPTMVSTGAQGKYGLGDLRGIGAMTPWGTAAPVFSGAGASAFQVPDNPANTGLSLLGDGATTGFTMWSWLRADTASSQTNRMIFRSGSVGSMSYQLRDYNNTNLARGDLNYSSSSAVGGASSGVANTVWHMICVVFAAKKGYGYLNGVLMAVSSTGSGTLSVEAGNLFLCGDGTGATAGAAAAIDHIGMDRRPYGAAEVMELYRNPFRGFSTRLINFDFHISPMAPGQASGMLFGG